MESMEGAGFEQPEAVENKGFVAELEHVLESINPEEGYVPDRELQNFLLRQLPENLAEELHAHLMARDIEQQQIAAERGKEVKESPEEQVIRGEIFERLAAAQYGRAGAKAQDPRLAEDLSQELVQLMHDPERFTLGKQIGHIRNPDLAFFKINDQGKVEIEAAGEVKLGLLNERSADQIGGGFRTGVRKMVEAVNQLDNPEDVGLTAVAQSRSRGGYLGASEDLKVRLIVPADRNVEDKKNLVNRGDFRNQAYYRHFLDQLDEVEVLKSAFSRQEVAAMADHLMGKVRERYPQPSKS